MKKKNFLIVKNKPTKFYLWLIKMDKKFNKFSGYGKSSRLNKNIIKY